MIHLRRLRRIAASSGSLCGRFTSVTDLSAPASSVFARSIARPPWGMALPGTIELTIHVVLKACAYLWLDDPAAASELTPGSLALVPGGPDHHLASSPHTACLPHERFLDQQAREDHSGHPDAAVFMCGAYRFRGDVGQGLLRSLPPILVLRPSEWRLLLPDLAIIRTLVIKGTPMAFQMMVISLAAVTMLSFVTAITRRSPIKSAAPVRSIRDQRGGAR